jgi:hypothetical protein
VGSGRGYTDTYYPRALGDVIRKEPKARLQPSSLSCAGGANADVVLAMASGSPSVAHYFLVRLRLKLKRSPVLTLVQGKALIQSVPGLPELDFQLALEIVTYHQQRNFVGYCSHRKRTLKTLKRKRAHHYTVHHSSHNDLMPLRGYRPAAHRLRFALHASSKASKQLLCLMIGMPRDFAMLL